MQVVKVDLFTSSVGVFDRGLSGVAVVLGKGAKHAAASRVSEPDLLHARLRADMFPLFRQVQIVCDFGRQAPARLAGLAVPPALDGEPSLAELQQQIASTAEFLKGLVPSQFAGRDELQVTFPVGTDSMTLPAAQYLLGFAIPNFFFHHVMAYAILRSLGVDLGKPDYFGMRPESP